MGKFRRVIESLKDKGILKILSNVAKMENHKKIL